MTITKLTSKIKKQKDTASSLSKYWLWYLIRLLIHFKIKTKFKSEIFKLFTESLRYKGQSKENRKRDDKNNCLICFLRGQFLDSKAKTRGIALNIYEVHWDLFIYTRKFKEKKYFCQKFKLDKVVSYMHSFINSM